MNKGAGIKRKRRGSGGTSGLDTLLQRFQLGELTTLDICEGTYPDDADPVLLTAEITGITVVSSTSITLTFDEPNAVVLEDSPDSAAKYIRFSGTGDPEFLSLGEAGNDFDAQVISDELEWILGDHVDLTDFPITALTEDIDHVEVTPESLTVGETSEYDVACELQDASSARLNRIGVEITADVATVSGAGGGTITTGVRSSRYGEFPTLIYTAGIGDSIERIDTTVLGTFEGSSANIAVNLLNAEHTFTVKDTRFFSGSGYSTPSVTLASGTHMLVISENATSSGSNTPSASGLTFTKIGEVDLPVSGGRISVFSAPCPAGFTGIVNFTGPAGGLTGFSAVIEDLTSIAVDDLSLVSANTVEYEDWSSTAPAAHEIDYTDSFSDPNNAGFLVALEYGDQASSPTRDGWTELFDTNNGGALRAAVQYRIGSDPENKAAILYAAAASYVFAMIFELAAVRS